MEEFDSERLKILKAVESIIKLFEVLAEFNDFDCAKKIVQEKIVIEEKRIAEEKFRHDWVIEGTELKKYCGEDYKIVIPNSVTSIGDNAFRNCKKLKNVTISNKVKSMGNVHSLQFPIV